ncbi:DUF6968 family protein [Bosea psychrotolerans]|uniref:DUF6968 family protein n=1 Tax=Bosea psychrotolerans TaxID=1871628 RepID=UPI0011B0F231|nr:hypothetical protein [Bosea psychrotolerans]
MSFVKREFQIGSAQVSCSFGKPTPDGDVFRCDYTIEFPLRTRAFRAIGVDEIQSLLLAMQMAHTDLLASPENQATGVSWLGMTDLGLPLPPGIGPDDFKAKH